MSMNVIILLKGGKIKWVGEVGGNVANSYANDQSTLLRNSLNWEFKFGSLFMKYIT